MCDGRGTIACRRSNFCTGVTARLHKPHPMFCATCRMPLEVRDIAVGAGRQQFMHTVSAGDQSAPPMVVLPGYGAGSGFFFRNVDGLAQHFRLHCVDLLGTGMSGVTHLPILLTLPCQPCCMLSCSVVSFWVEGSTPSLHVQNAVTLFGMRYRAPAIPCKVAGRCRGLFPELTAALARGHGDGEDGPGGPLPGRLPGSFICAAVPAACPASSARVPCWRGESSSFFATLSPRCRLYVC